MQILLQPRASIHEGPAAPSVRRAAVRMDAASMQSNMTGWTVGGRYSTAPQPTAEAVSIRRPFFLPTPYLFQKADRHCWARIFGRGLTHFKHIRY